VDADTKLRVSYLVGGRDAGWPMEFLRDCASRITGRQALRATPAIEAGPAGHAWSIEELVSFLDST